MKIIIPHKLGKTEALKRIKGLLEKVKEKYKDKIEKVDEKWKGNEGEYYLIIYRYELNGKIEVTDKDIKLSGKLPWTLSLFKNKIEKIIITEAKKLLN